MGVVYLAEDTRLDRSVAIKFLPPTYFENTQAIKRFRREAQSAAALNHPYICYVYDVGDHEGQPYLVMEFLKGETLKQLLEKGAVEVSAARQWASQIASALRAAHEEGILHRDIKPANVFVTSDGYAKLLDFGLAKRLDPEAETEPDLTTALTKAGATLGTLAYMSPEQLRGQDLDERTDIFSFGVLLYEMLGGIHLFRGESHVAPTGAILHRDPPSLAERRRDHPVISRSPWQLP